MPHAVAEFATHSKPCAYQRSGSQLEALRLMKEPGRLMHPLAGPHLNGRDTLPLPWHVDTVGVTSLTSCR